MKVLLSIKPEFAYKIFSGEKRYEFRRVLFKNRAVSTVVVYASSPVKKVIGEFEIEAILSEDLSALWDKTGGQAGISKDFFDSYFTDKEIGHAIKVKSVTRYKHPLCIKEHFQVTPPQSFIYI